ncbi:MAG TPA: hypothetical protein VD963_03135 [Phycisphaerales bacterium]|nr:hypothetical protein [Phycisphaerales bacterium]
MSAGASGGAPPVTGAVPAPARDLGPPAGRPDPARVLGQSGLPPALRDLVGTVVSRTRLWRHERADVARELVSHFAEGLEAGASVERLAALFGDPVPAARLIRRAKKRARSLAWHAWVRWWQFVGLVLALIGVVWGVFAVPFFMRTPRVARDYFGEVTAPARAVPESQRAWPVYLGAIQAADYRGMAEQMEHISDHPGMKGWEAVVQIVDSRQESIRLYRHAAGMPALGLVPSDQASKELAQILNPAFTPDPVRSPEPGPQPLGTILLPSLNEMRKGARLLAADARVAATRGEAERVVDDLVALTGLAHHANAPPRLLINQLVEWAVLALQYQLVGELIARHPGLLSESQLAGLAHHVAGASPRDFRPDYSVERALFEDWVQRVYSDNRRGNGRLTFAGWKTYEKLHGAQAETWKTWLAGPLLSAWFPSRARLGAVYEEALTSAEAYHDIPLWERTGPGPDERFKLEHESGRLPSRYLMIAGTIAPLTKIGLTAHSVSQRRDATLVVLALEIHRLRHGAYPRALDELVPALIPTIPTDRFDGQSFRYRLAETGPILYSVGMDLDDDIGRAPRDPHADVSLSQFKTPAELAELKRSPREWERVDGDWILWPPAPRADR